MGPPPDPGLLPLDDSALPEVHGHLPARCGQRALAEDLTAETFLAAVRAGDVPLSVGWLIGTARHELVDHWRRLEREDRGLRLLEGGRPDVEDPWDAELDALRDREVLDRLGPAHRPTGGPAMSSSRPTSWCATPVPRSPAVPGRVPDGWQVEGPTPMVGIGGGATEPGMVPMYAVDDITAALTAVESAGGAAGEVERQSYGLGALCHDDQGLPFWLGQLG
ncbi:MAG TPA: sigma factor [Modestobacter sp.]|nr:sigma factor [Modestobacter sp.]